MVDFNYAFVRGYNGAEGAPSDWVPDDSTPSKRLARSLERRSDLFAWAYALINYAHAGWQTFHLGVESPLSPNYVPVTGELIEKECSKHRPFQIAYGIRLKAIIALCRANGIEPVFLTQPILVGAGRDDVTGIDLERCELDGISGKARWAVLELYNDTLRSVGTEQGALVIDLARDLPKSSRYYVDANHYSNEGARWVAAIASGPLAGWLRSRFPSFAE